MKRLIAATGMTALGLVALAPAAFAQFIGGASGIGAGGFNVGPQFRGGMSPGIVGGFYRPGSPASITVLSPGIVYNGAFAGPRLQPMNNWAQPVFGGTSSFLGFGPMGTNPPMASTGMATWFGGVPVIQQISPNPIVLTPQYPAFASGPAFNPMFRGPMGTNPPMAGTGMATWFGR